MNKNIIERTQFLFNNLVTISTTFCVWCNCKTTKVIKHDKGRCWINVSESDLIPFWGKALNKWGSGVNEYSRVKIDLLLDIANNVVEVRDITYAQHGTCILSLSQTATEARVPILRDLWCSDWVDTYSYHTWDLYPESPSYPQLPSSEVTHELPYFGARWSLL